MSVDVKCNSDSLLIFRFYDHARLGLTKTIQDHKENWKEELGNKGLWFVEELPKKAWAFAKDPRVVTVALTALALVADSYLFYPAMTSRAIMHVVSLINIKDYLWTIKFAAYILSVETIVSYAARAYGRFSNEGLMTSFYGKASAVPSELKTNKTDLVQESTNDHIATNSGSEILASAGTAGKA